MAERKRARERRPLPQRKPPEEEARLPGQELPGQKLRAEKRPRAKAPKAARAALARQLPVESPQHRYAGRATGSLRLLPTFFWRCLSVSPDILSISYNLRVRISSTIPTTPDWRPCRTRSSGGAFSPPTDRCWPGRMWRRTVQRRESIRTAPCSPMLWGTM